MGVRSEVCINLALLLLMMLVLHCSACMIYYLRTICRLLPSTPPRLLLTELGLLPLQVFWWRRPLQFWKSLAVLPVGSLYHTLPVVLKHYSPRRRYRQLPVSGRHMQHFLQFRLGCHGLPIATCRLAGTGHVDRADRVCLACNSGAIGNEMQMVFECTTLAPLRQQHADLFAPRTDTMLLFSSAGPSGGFEIPYRLSRSHATLP